MSLSANIKNFAIAVFFIVLSYCTWNLHNHTIEKIDFVTNELQLARQDTSSKIDGIHQDLFAFLHDTTDKLDSRISSIESNTFKQTSLIRSDLNVRLDKLTTTVDSVAVEYTKIPTQIEGLTSRFDIQTDCGVNDLCWQNMVSDLIIDTRNTMRDGSTTFRTVNAEVPKITEDISNMTKDISAMSSSISESTPRITENVAQITENVSLMTRPKWWHKVLSYGIGTLGIVIAAK